MTKEILCHGFFIGYLSWFGNWFGNWFRLNIYLNAQRLTQKWTRDTNKKRDKRKSLRFRDTKVTEHRVFISFYSKWISKLGIFDRTMTHSHTKTHWIVCSIAFFVNAFYYVRVCIWSYFLGLNGTKNAFLVSLSLTKNYYCFDHIFFENKNRIKLNKVYTRARAIE